MWYKILIRYYSTDGISKKIKECPFKASQYSRMFTRVDPARNALCKEKSVIYTHPIKWKNQSLISFLRELEPDLNIGPEAYICRNCRDDLGTGQKNVENYQPRWVRKSFTCNNTACEVPGCDQPAARATKLGTREEIGRILNCTPLDGEGHPQTKLCNDHYRALHKKLNPDNYQWKCAACSTAIKGSNYCKFLTCSEPDTFQKHIVEHTDFSGTISANEKICMACYRYSLTLTKLSRDKPKTDDEDFLNLIEGIQNTVPSLPFNLTQESELIDLALKMTIISVAQELHANHALTLLCAHQQFLANVTSLLPMSTLRLPPEKLGTHRWLLGQLSSHLKHHMSYACIVRKHGTILYRQGRELQALSHAIFSSKISSGQDVPN